MATAFVAVFAFFLLACQSIVHCFDPPHMTKPARSAQGTNERCVVQQICNGGPSPQAIEDLFKLVKEMKTKMEFMEKKMIAFCKGDCPLKQFPRNCAEVYKSGNTTSGVYTIKPDSGPEFAVYCDQITDGGGWTVFQRRQNGSVDFYRGWQEYKNGFGAPHAEFWLGLDKIHRLTRQARNMLRVDLEDFQKSTAYAEYDDFLVKDESKNFLLKLGDYSGTAGDSLSVADNMAFSTKDRDNDIWPSHCAVEHRAAWWYRNCHKANLNGVYFKGNYNARSNGRYAHGVVWQTWLGYYYSLKHVTMKIRPAHAL